MQRRQLSLLIVKSSVMLSKLLFCSWIWFSMQRSKRHNRYVYDRTYIFIPGEYQGTVLNKWIQDNIFETRENQS